MPELRELRDNVWAIAAPAVPGVLLAIVLTAVLLVGGAALIRASPVRGHAAGHRTRPVWIVRIHHHVEHETVGVRCRLAGFQCHDLLAIHAARVRHRPLLPDDLVGEVQRQEVRRFLVAASG